MKMFLCNKMLCLVMAVAVAGGSFAGQSFHDLGDDHLFSNPDNWAQGKVPDDSTTNPGDLDPAFYTDATMWDNGAICVINDVHECYGLSIGAFNGSLEVVVQSVEGGDLTIGNWGLNISRNSHHSKLFMTGGKITTPYINIPNMDDPQKGTLIMQDGVIDSGWMNVSPGVDAVGEVKLYGGVINLTGFLEIDTPSGLIEVGGGSIVIDGDVTDLLGDYIDGFGGTEDPRIVPLPGYSVELDYDVTNQGRTTLKAVSDLAPQPANQAEIPYAEISSLDFTMPDPLVAGGSVSCDVYFGDAVWQSLNNTGAEDAYLAAGGVDGDWIPEPNNLPLIEADVIDGSVDVAATEAKEYHWQVKVYDDTVDGVVGGPKELAATYTFKFDAVANQAPVVEAGDDIYTWLDGGTASVTLQGVMVEDDEVPEPAVATWSVIEAVGLVPEGGGEAPDIDPSTYSFTPTDGTGLNAQLNVSVSGYYELQLDAADSEPLSAYPDTMTVYVRDDSCEVSKIHPDYEPMMGDANEDCYVDMEDFAAVAADWLGSVDAFFLN
ncbi:hypothetical protein [Sedimentisphaera salicampi]|uniref:Uncharacterized protein n=1 Tax=Sedimentisphaera salicampi TaxID=1941349 RepID=A0A1W6LK91_9BACT|nr:hypothetical protein [Sedimentisphaera salicampi]ARN56163.1 hypothetical protein STSP1_00536 [Sedimentisphaera salicampi]OXU15741.1 hypothetical protein SMSP1_00530 [Sedimentisphaera salicampi]